MNDKKHIDRLFQEGFKDFEATPSNAVWKNIEANLTQKKQKRRVIPIWWRYAGVAALLLLLLTIGVTIFNNTDEPKPNQVVDTENTEIKTNTPLNNNPETTIASDDITQEEAVDDALNIASETIKKHNASNETSIAETSASTNKNESKSNLVSPNKLNIKQNNSITPISNNAIANSSSKEKSSPNTIQNEVKNNIKNLQNELEKNTEVVTTSESDPTDSKTESPIITKDKAKTLISEPSKKNTAITNSNDKKTEELVTNKNPDDNKLSIEDAIKENNTIAKENTKPTSRWSVTPNVAPVYYNTLKDGSSIDPQFNNNDKTGDINMSYGINASYAINKKISVRSGIHSVNLGYNTNDVVVFQSVGTNRTSSALQNIDPASNNVSLISSETFSADVPADIASSNASINQNLRYIEIPFEIQYTLSDKKFGVNLIGGFSSFFLNTSKVFYEEDNGNRTILGEASNLNKLSYSANFGLGLNYKISKKFNFNLEPMFKYQFNTFNNTSGNFSPYFIGIYSGFAIKF